MPPIKPSFFLASSVVPNKTTPIAAKATAPMPKVAAPKADTSKNEQVLAKLTAERSAKAAAKEAEQEALKPFGATSYAQLSFAQNIKLVPFTMPLSAYSLNIQKYINPDNIASETETPHPATQAAPKLVALGVTNYAVLPVNNTVDENDPILGLSTTLPAHLFEVKPSGGGGVTPTGTIAFANGLEINPNSKTLTATRRLLDSGNAHTGRVGTCVTVVTENSDAAGWDPMNGGGSSGDPNNTRGFLSQAIQNGGVSPETSNTNKRTLNSPYGNVSVNMYENDGKGSAIEKLQADVAAGLIPDSAIIAAADTVSVPGGGLNSTAPAPWGSNPSSSGRDVAHIRIKNGKIIGHYNWANTPGNGAAYRGNTGQFVVILPPDAVVKKPSQQIAAQP
jgi:hypothetical protein